MDKTDRAILEALQKDSSRPMAELAEAVMVSHIRRAFHAYANAHIDQRIPDVSQAAE